MISKQNFPVLVLGYTVFWHHKIKNSSIQGLCQATNLYEIADSLPCCMTAESHWTSEVSGLAIFHIHLVWRCKPLFVVISIVTLGCWDNFKPPVSVRVTTLSLPLLCVCEGRKLWLIISDKMGSWHSVSATPVCLQHILPDLHESTSVWGYSFSKKLTIWWY